MERNSRDLWKTKADWYPFCRDVSLCRGPNVKKERLKSLYKSTKQQTLWQQNDRVQHHWTRSSASSIYPPSTQSLSVRSVLVPRSNVRNRFPTIILYEMLGSCPPAYPTNRNPLDAPILTILVNLHKSRPSSLCRPSVSSCPAHPSYAQISSQQLFSTSK
jgi:hypothetical protein